MSEARRQVLQMLRDGKLTAEDAMELLAAMPEEERKAEETAVSPTPLATPPNLNHLRRFWRLPFLISATFLLLTAFWLRQLYISSDGAINLWFFCVWSLFILAVIATALAFASRQSTWLHVRVREANGSRVQISLPLPLRLARWGLSVARGFVPANVRTQLETAELLITSASDELRQPDAEPIYIEVDEDDTYIQIFFG